MEGGKGGGPRAASARRAPRRRRSSPPLAAAGFGKESTKYTVNGPGKPGGSSWTAEWLKFDNSYFADIKEQKDEELLVLPTDAAMFDDPAFRPYAEKYAVDQDAFFADYVEAHLRLSEQGVKWAEGAPVELPPP